MTESFPAVAPAAIQAVLFDIDDTLVDFRASAAAGIGRVLAEVTLDSDLEPFWHELTERHYPRFLAGEVTFTDMQLERLAELLAWAGLPVPEREGLLELERQRQHAMTENYRLFPDVLPCLAALSDRIVGVISNSDGPHQRAKLASVGLDDAFQVTVVSGDHGFAKPDPRIFLEACRQLALDPGAVAYVGDRLETDAVGAARAGLTGIWLDRTGRAAVRAELLRADPRIVAVTTLDELPGLLGGSLTSGFVDLGRSR